jgi:hypothetical protein
MANKRVYKNAAAVMAKLLFFGDPTLTNKIQNIQTN